MTDQPQPSTPAPDDLPEQVKVRREKRDRLLASGVEPYPVGFPRTHTVAEIRQKYGELGPDARTGDRVGVTGRVMLNRVGGKLSFATIRDGANDIQIMLSLAVLGEDALNRWKTEVDLGDLVGVEGEVITSRRGELSILADHWQITAKCLRPLPEKHKGLTDPETRVRQRYLDLIVNPEARQTLILRSELVSSLRDSCHRRGFIEVETPMLQTLHGGASARPFVTHINTYHLDLYLRIAPELFLKRLLVGGIEKVFEINRNFRNEGVDATHNPEFTMLEAYQAYGDYNTMATFTRELVQEAADRLFG
ncbi:MAG TPA: amino acid--tRNA ligase-related protein, partial [Actinomycetes bacterium]|nr:amino acid--tRNA ligase-related protein [Actinomycetes bacterium]